MITGDHTLDTFGSQKKDQTRGAIVQRGWKSNTFNASDTSSTFDRKEWHLFPQIRK